MAAGRIGELSASGQALLTTIVEARVKKQDLAYARGGEDALLLYSSLILHANAYVLNIHSKEALEWEDEDKANLAY